MQWIKDRYIEGPVTKDGKFDGWDFPCYSGFDSAGGLRVTLFQVGTDYRESYRRCVGDDDCPETGTWHWLSDGDGSESYQPEGFDTRSEALAHWKIFNS